MAIVCLPVFNALADSETPISEEALICSYIGVMRGDVNGINSEYLAKNSSRLQAMFITTRLTGKENYALTYTGRDNFTDANRVADEYGRNLLAYVKAHPEFGWQGDYGGNIDPYGLLTAQAMYKVVLTVLGYNLGADYTWDETISFAYSKGMGSMSTKRGFLTNGDISKMLVEALKTRKKGSEETLCEYLTRIGVIDDFDAYDSAMLPGSIGYKPLLKYKEGGPLLVETTLNSEQKRVGIRFNTALNPTYAKSLRNYSYYMPGAGYIPLPSRCSTSMVDESTVVIQFPLEGWNAYNNRVETDAFAMFIGSERKNEIRISGLVDVDGVLLRDVLIDVPSVKRGDANGKRVGFVGSKPETVDWASALNPAYFLK